MDRSYTPMLGLVVFWVTMGLLSSAQTQPKASADAGASIQLVSYQVVQLELRAPVRLRDPEGKEQSYHRAYLITLNGTFPRDQGLGFELFIGDYRIPEYGGTREGLYFRIYDPKIVSSLEGKEFGYRFGGKEVRSFGMRFSMKRAQPLKVIQETLPVR
jgi:hypothetical protein